MIISLQQNQLLNIISRDVHVSLDKIRKDKNKNSQPASLLNSSKKEGNPVDQNHKGSMPELAGDRLIDAYLINVDHNTQRGWLSEYKNDYVWIKKEIMASIRHIEREQIEVRNMAGWLTAWFKKAKVKPGEAPLKKKMELVINRRPDENYLEQHAALCAK